MSDAAFSIGILAVFFPVLLFTGAVWGMALFSRDVPPKARLLVLAFAALWAMPVAWCVHALYLESGHPEAGFSMLEMIPILLVWGVLWYGFGSVWVFAGLSCLEERP